MAEDRYVNIESVLEILRVCCQDDDNCVKSGVDMRELLDKIENLPSDDVAKVVRCIDCINVRKYIKRRKKDPQEYYCDYPDEINVVKPDDFCAWGYGKEEALDELHKEQQSAMEEGCYVDFAFEKMTEDERVAWDCVANAKTIDDIDWVQYWDMESVVKRYCKLMRMGTRIFNRYTWYK